MLKGSTTASCVVAQKVLSKSPEPLVSISPRRRAAEGNENLLSTRDESIPQARERELRKESEEKIYEAQCKRY